MKYLSFIFPQYRDAKEVQILCWLQSSQEILKEHLEILILVIRSFSVGEHPACHWKTYKHASSVRPFLQICSSFKLMTLECCWHTVQQQDKACYIQGTLGHCFLRTNGLSRSTIQNIKNIKELLTYQEELA